MYIRAVGQDILDIVADRTDVRDLKIKEDVGFYNTAPQTKPTVTGSRAGNAALADLLTELATLGLITDSSSA